MNRSLKITAAAMVLTCSVAYARAGYVSLPVKVDKSHLIAKVEVLSTAQIVPYYEKSETGRLKMRALKAGEYRSQAEVRVIQSIKGLKAGAIYTLEFDNGFICPNVWYEKGDVCLVFNTKMQNGHYETFNTQFGKYTVKENKVTSWKLNSDETTPFEKVVSQITEVMQAPKETK